jgi:ComF family protein
MLPQLIDIRSKFNHFMLPQQCLLCAALAGNDGIFHDCNADLPWQHDPCCPVCALPSGTGEVCGACLQHPPVFNAKLAALKYQFPINLVLQRYKYAGLLAVSEVTGELLAGSLRGESKQDLIIPMPLHFSRLLERGFNQAAEIARVVARELGIPLDLHACSQARPTKSQVGLSLQESKKSLRGVFACRQTLGGKRVALLDDIMTTGASLNELAKTVKDAGAAKMECWVVARTLRQ